jgi:hypothetical protein
VAIINTRTGKEVSSLWLIPLVPGFLVGLFFVVVTGLTSMAVAASVLDRIPSGYVGPDPMWIDQVLIIEVRRFDRWLVSLVGLSCPWLAAVPGFAAHALWEWATTHH